MTRLSRLAPLYAVAAFVCVVAETRGGEDAERPAPNLELIRSLARRVGESIGRTLASQDSMSMTVTLLPRESAMYVESALLQGLSLSPFRIAAAGESELSVDFSIGDIRVEYSNIRRDGFLGSRLVDRRVSLLLSAKAFERKSGAVRIAKDYAEQATDTIPLSAVPGIESPLLPLTRGSVPSEGFFTNVAEPLVMLGAIAVAVYLLYSVRN